MALAFLGMVLLAVVGANAMRVNRSIQLLRDKPYAFLRPLTGHKCTTLRDVEFSSSLSPKSLTYAYSSESSENSLSTQKGLSPWAYENIPNDKKGRNNKSRFRQHVNPLSRKFQIPTELPENWPNDGTYKDPTLPIHIDIGCGKGGFLIDLASEMKSENSKNLEKRNYLGLEIRPQVAQYAKERISTWDLSGTLDFIGCNVNVDLERILRRYSCHEDNHDECGEVALVSVQFPDPHFKKQHQKRRVITPALVHILAKYLKEGREIFIQSDIKDVFDNMRKTIREEGGDFFIDMVEDENIFMTENPIGIPTEREVSVIDQGLPVYRTIFRRNDKKFSA